MEHVTSQKGKQKVVAWCGMVCHRCYIYEEDRSKPTQALAALGRTLPQMTKLEFILIEMRMMSLLRGHSSITEEKGTNKSIKTIVRNFEGEDCKTR